MSGKDYSKQDIAKQFDLPERKSKIATLLKEADIYCICRSSDSTRFMIACDHCEEWYHGDCINITEPESRYIKKYFCPPCMEMNPSLEIVYKKAKPSSSNPKYKSKSSSSSDKKHESKQSSSSSKSKKSSFLGRGDSKRSSASGSGRCGTCSGCLAVVDCFKCDVCTKSHKYTDKKRRICRKRECLNKDDDSDSEYESKKPSLQVLSERQADITDEEDNWVPSPVKTKKQKLTPSKRGKKQQKLKEKSKDKSRRRQKAQREQRESSSTDSCNEIGSENSDSDDDKQCFGLDCVNVARKNSKYCSPECCLDLATQRIYRILPGRIQEWNLTPSTAEERNKKDLEEIRRKQIETKTRISELEKKRADIDRHVQTVQQITVDPNDEDDEPEEEGIIHCITCGHEIAVKTCLKHMERCYNKYESQTSFGSIYKTKLEGTPIFCDFYNPANGTYCKRLAVLCPEHSKEPKVGDTEVCGCPQVRNLFEATGKFCRVPKKKCNKHFCWEKLRRAEIDMERVRSWLKLDELLEQERQIRVAMSNRGGVMGLLLHSTFDHDLRNRIKVQLEKEAEEASKQQKPKTPEQNNEDDISTGEDEDFTREALVKSRDQKKRLSVDSQKAKTEITASKLFKMSKKEEKE